MQEESSEKSVCYCCSSPYFSWETKCDKCGYPLKGTPEEQKEFSINYTLKNYDGDLSRNKVRSAQSLFFIISALTFISAFIYFILGKTHWIFLVIDINIGLAYISFAIWSKYKAFAAIFTGSIFFISLFLLKVILIPHAIGILVLIINITIIVFLIRTCIKAYKHRL